MNGVKHHEGDKDQGIVVAEKLQIAQDSGHFKNFGTSEGYKGIRNLDRDAEPQKIKSEEMKLTKIHQTFAENADVGFA